MVRCAAGSSLTLWRCCIGIALVCIQEVCSSVPRAGGGQDERAGEISAAFGFVELPTRRPVFTYQRIVT